jgi:phosphatidylglycerol lysyltransferase
MLVLGAARPALLQRVLLRFQSVVNGLAARLKRSGPLDEDWALQISEEFTAAATAAQTNPSRLLVMLLWAIGAHLVQVLSLYALFLAFRQPVTVSVCLAGYAMGHLFVIIAPTPQGVGFVETIMPLTFIALGVPGAVATIVVLAFRGLTFWLPLLAGFILMQRLKSLGAEEERALTEQWSVRIVALLTALMGLVNIVSVVYPGLAQDLEEVTRYAPLQLRRGGQVGAILTGLALLLLAHGLWRRKRAAWLITLGVLFLSAISHTLNRSLWDYRTLLTLALGAWLLLLRAHFHARSDQPSVRFGLAVLSAAVLFNLAYATAGLLFVASRVGQALELPAAIGQALRLVFTFRPPAWLGQSDPGRFLIYSLYSIDVLTVLYALYHLLRPVLLRQPAGAEERERAREVVAAYGKSSLARHALQPGNAYFFTPGGSLLAFQLQGRTAVAYGDPIGPLHDVPQAIAAFAHYCQRNDWLPAFYQVVAANLPYYEEAGFDSLTIGREAVIDVGHDGRLVEDSDRLDHTVARLLRQGYRAEFITPPHAQPLLNELRLINDEWLTVRHAMDKRFALSWFDEEYVQKSPLLLVRTPSGFISAFASLILKPEDDSAAVDLFRYRPQVAEGTMELLFLTLLRWARVQQLGEVQLGVSLGSTADEQAINSLADAIFGSMDGQFATPELDELKETFQPRWLPRYLVYPGTTTLPAVWNAVIRANAGIGLPWLFFKQRLRL